MRTTATRFPCRRHMIAQGHLLRGAVCLLGTLPFPGASMSFGRDVIPEGHHSVHHVVRINLEPQYAEHTLIRYHHGPWENAQVEQPGAVIRVIGAPYTTRFALLPPGTELPATLDRASIPANRLELDNPIRWERSAPDSDPTARIETDLLVASGPDGPELLEVQTRRLGRDGGVIANGSPPIALLAIMGTAAVLLVLLMARRRRTAGQAGEG